MKKLALVVIVFIVSACVAGCTVSQASDKDQYGNYLSELNNGNTDFGQARTYYDGGMRAFSSGINYNAIDAMNSAAEYYDLALTHYGQMEDFSEGRDQKAYATALKSYAESCKYAARSYAEAYKAYDTGDRHKGELRMGEAATFVTQANGYHDQAVKLQSMAIQ